MPGGNHHRAALDALGAGNVMYSVDYPSESMTEAAEWLDASKLDAHVRAKIEPGKRPSVAETRSAGRMTQASLSGRRRRCVRTRRGRSRGLFR